MNPAILKYNAYFFIWLSIFFLASSIQAQTVQVFNEEIGWIDRFEKEKNASTAVFPGYTHIESQDYSVMAFEKRIEVRGNYIDSEVELEVLGVENMNKSVLSPDEQMACESEFRVHKHFKKGKKNTELIIQVVPIRKLPGGNYERLVNFNLNVRHIPGLAKNRGGGGNTAENSVLQEGDWYKIAIGRDGVYRLTYSDLEGLGISVSSIDPQQLNLYGNGGTQLPIQNDDFFYDDLQKNAIRIVGENDGVFNTSDYILFYGKGPDGWKYDDDRFEHNKHHYSDSAYYYLRVNDDAPKRIEGMNLSNGTTTHVVNDFDDYRYVENNSVNLVKSGRTFYGDYFAYNSTLNYSFNFPNMTADSVTIESNLVARSVGGESSYDLAYNGQSFNVEIDETFTSVVSLVAKTKESRFKYEPSGDNVNLAIDFNGFTPDAEGWLDWIRVNARRSLTMVGTQLHFRNTESVGPGNVSEFQLVNASIVHDIWDITDITNITALLPEAGDEQFFKVNTDELRQFVAFANVNYLTPRLVGPVANQNLHAMIGTDLIIVSSPLLLSQSEEIAELHRGEGLFVEVVTPFQVYNEFSSGNPDVTAIKKFMKHLYDMAPSEEERIRYLLMMGDASYKGNKSWNAGNTYNVICYESLNSLSPTNSYVSDDYFAFLEDTAGELATDDLLIVVGRIPVSSSADADAFVNKIRIYMGENANEEVCSSYTDDTAYGPWRNRVVFVSDDKDGNGGATESNHMATCEEHSDSIYTKYNDYNVEKIYMDSYQQFSTPGGERYPDGNAAIRNSVEDGALLVTYIGHGGERGWAHERILNTTTIKEFENLYKLPVFFTATCELARYDNPDEISAGEFLLNNPQGGGVAMLTTTRIVFSGDNHDLGVAFFNVVFEYEEDLEFRLGDIARLTKNLGPQSANTRNFSLLGDPALRMSYPEKSVYTTEINGNLLSEVPDTLKALQQVNIKGYVGDGNGNILSDFNGFVYPTVYDKMDTLTTLDNDDSGSDFNYKVFRSILYKGKATVSNGEFEFNFIVPKDINYNYGNARVSYYAVDGSVDGNGHNQEFIIGGIAEGVEENLVGPEIQLYMNDSTFVFGGLTDEDPYLFAKIFDENGINTAGTGIGHDITATLDGQNNSQYVLNNNYEADLDTYKSGQLRYPFNDLSEGRHTLKLKVWDVFNNSSEAYTEFVVASSAGIALEHVLNYPNPFTTHTEFFFEHNQACEYLEARIQIFTVSGKLVKTINQVVTTEGYRSEGIPWDGKDDFGDNIGKGVYVYKLEVKTPTGIKAEEFEKLVILK